MLEKPEGRNRTTTNQFATLGVRNKEFPPDTEEPKPFNPFLTGQVIFCKM